MTGITPVLVATTPARAGRPSNCDDNCPDDENVNQEDEDSDGVGDVCDESSPGGSEECSTPILLFMDNGDAGFSDNCAPAISATGGYQGSYAWILGTSPNAPGYMQFEFNDLPNANYEVAMTWNPTTEIPSFARNTAVEIEIYDGAAVADTFTLNQNNAPGDDYVEGGKNFQILGSVVPIFSGTLRVKILIKTPGSSYKTLSADAVRIECMGDADYEPPEDAVSGPDPCYDPTDEFPEDFNGMITKGLDWLKDNQITDGGMNDGSWDPSGSSSHAGARPFIVGWALLGLTGHGHSAVAAGPYQETVCRAIAYMIRNQGENGFWGSTAWWNGACGEESYTNLTNLWGMSEALIAGNNALIGGCDDPLPSCDYSYGEHLDAVNKSIQYCIVLRDDYDPSNIPTEPETIRTASGAGGSPTCSDAKGGWHYNESSAMYEGGDILHHPFGVAAMLAAQKAGGQVPNEEFTICKDFLRARQFNVEESGGYWVGTQAYHADCGQYWGGTYKYATCGCAAWALLGAPTNHPVIQEWVTWTMDNASGGSFPIWYNENFVSRFFILSGDDTWNGMFEAHAMATQAADGSWGGSMDTAARLAALAPARHGCFICD